MNASVQAPCSVAMPTPPKPAPELIEGSSPKSGTAGQRSDAVERQQHLALVVCHPERTGGMETFCRFLVDTALSAGWRVTVALSGENIYDHLADNSPQEPCGAGVSPVRCRGSETGSPYHRDQLVIDPVDWLDRACAGDREYRWSRIRDRRRWFRRVRPDVALFVQSSNTPFRAAMVGAWLAGVPMVTTHRTMAWPVDQVPSRRHLFGLIAGIGLHHRRLIRKAWLTAALADRIVYNSRAVRQGYETLYRYPTRKGHIIVNAVRPETPQRGPSSAVAPASSERPPDPVTIGFVGRIGADKRLDILLRAVASFSPPYPGGAGGGEARENHSSPRNTPLSLPLVRGEIEQHELNACHKSIRLRIHGQGADQANLMRLATDLAMERLVDWPGPTDDVWSAYADMDIVVLCSPRESSSNMVLEAMAAGKTVVVTRAGGSPELVDHGQCGICVPPLDVPALAAALKRLIDDEPLRKQLGDRARAKALAQHDAKQVGRAWLELFNEMVSRADSDARNHPRASTIEEPRASARAVLGPK